MPGLAMAAVKARVWWTICRSAGQHAEVHLSENKAADFVGERQKRETF